MNSKILITIGNDSYMADFYESDVSKSLMEQFPLTIKMDEHQGQEYFSPLENRPYGESENTDAIVPGDITLCNSSSISIFYNQPAGSVSYVKLGHINNPEGLDSSLSRCEGRVTFELF